MRRRICAAGICDGRGDDTLQPSPLVGEGGARSAPGEGSVFVQMEFGEQVFQSTLSHPGRASPARAQALVGEGGAQSAPGEGSVVVQFDLRRKTLRLPKMT